LAEATLLLEPELSKKSRANRQHDGDQEGQYGADAHGRVS
jgi:hypothetical protein